MVFIRVDSLACRDTELLHSDWSVRSMQPCDKHRSALTTYRSRYISCGWV